MLRVVGICLLLYACAGEPLTPEEREYKDSIEFQKWHLCPRDRGLHVDHTERDHKPGHWSISQDIARNQTRCMKVWRAYGFE